MREKNMPGLEQIPGWLTGGVGASCLYIAYRFFWPSIRDSLSGQASQWRSENRYIAQLEASRDRALEERDEAVKERNELYQRLTKLEAKMEVMAYRFELSQAEVQRLTSVIQGRRGGDEADH